VGAGCGSLTEFCIKQDPHCRLVAVDLSGEMLDVLSARFPEVICVQGDVMDYKDSESFDCIWCNACFGNFYDPSAVFRHLCELMAPGAVLNISHPMGRKFQAGLHGADPLTVPYLLPGSKKEAQQVARGTAVTLERFLDEEAFYLVSYRHP
ncbi:MAG: class I SAM-dependent methyltransferase, partial [Endozoicomonas sp.]